MCLIFCCVIFFNDTATTEIYTYLHTLSLHAALPIFLRLDRHARFITRAGDETKTRADRAHRGARRAGRPPAVHVILDFARTNPESTRRWRDRKSTRLNSSH